MNNEAREGDVAKLRLGLNAATVRRGGLMQIPKPILEHLGLEEGGVIAFEKREGGSVVILPAELQVRGVKPSVEGGARE